MAIGSIYEEVVHTRRFALSVVDALARALGTRGPLPPPLGAVVCEIPRQVAPAVVIFDPPLVLWTIRNASGFVIFDGTYARSGSTAARLPLQPGTYRLRIRGDYYQNLEFDLVWPPAGDDVRVPLDQLLLPGASYPFPPITPSTFPEPNTALTNRPYSRGFTLIRGSVLAPSGTPIAGAKAELINFVFQPFPPVPNPPPPAWTFLSCVTGDDGNWAILLPDRLRFKNVGPATTAAVTHPVTIRITQPDGAFIDVARTIALGTEVSLTQTALRGRTVDARGLALSGVTIQTSAGPATSQSRPDGQWSFIFPLNQPDVPAVTVTATTPGGASQSVTIAVVSGKTVVVPTFAFA
jgi:hypothetical protein